MPYRFGNRLQLTLDGESHGPELTAELTGLPAGEAVDLSALEALMARRAPGGELASSRREPDRAEFLSGLREGVTTGEPLRLRIVNVDARPGDYAALQTVPRPGHADYASYLKFGCICPGGGPFSGRMTAPLCAAGSIALQILARRGVRLGAHILSVRGIHDRPYDPVAVAPEDLAPRSFPVLDPAAAVAMQALIRQARDAGDSVGGVAECAVLGLPAGVGGPLFDGLESRLSAALFAIPAVKGVEFGAGFAAAGLMGSENNDPFVLEGGRIRTSSNHCGGILGGVSTGEALIFRCAFKPTPSIALPQQSVDLTSHAPQTVAVSGRHDPCVVPRAIPAVECAAALAILDLCLEEDLWK